jgi:competence ComEA-like helix-hairpin-helix protein
MLIAGRCPIVLVAAVAVSASALVSSRLAAQRTTDLTELPDGEGRATTERMCVTRCHPVAVLLNRRPPDQWRAFISLMKYKDEGLTGTPEEIKTVWAYLSRRVGRVNPNMDTKENVQLVLELSDATADALVAYRKAHGEFRSFDDLARVPGLTAEWIEQHKDSITFGRPF